MFWLTSCHLSASSFAYWLKPRTPAHTCTHTHAHLHACPNTRLAAPNVGPGGDISRYYGPLVSCGMHFGHHKTMVDAIQEYVPNTANATGDSSWDPRGGCKGFNHNATDVAAAAAMAKTADLVVVVLGTDLSQAAEGHDLANITIPDAQWLLFDAVAAVAKNPVVVVTVTANAIDIGPILNDPRVGAVVHAGQPSDSSLGVGDVLFGSKVPAGRAVQTVYDSAWQYDLSIFDMNMRPGISQFPRPDCAKPFTDCKNGTNPGRYVDWVGRGGVDFDANAAVWVPFELTS